ncbi:hypothetical protein WGE86_22450, partial [Xanthomonas euvesicatoria pv. euvesicatoria]|uniref:hypothetical protein n=1 Tax=Xanthomonas euvesicatoria TaxID=456327 RepID=UPI0032BFC0E1
ARVGLFDKPDDLLGAESALLHVRPLGFTDFIASAGTAQWGQVIASAVQTVDLTAWYLCCISCAELVRPHHKRLEHMQL